MGLFLSPTWATLIHGVGDLDPRHPITAKSVSCPEWYLDGQLRDRMFKYKLKQKYKPSLRHTSFFLNGFQEQAEEEQEVARLRGRPEALCLEDELLMALVVAR